MLALSLVTLTAGGCASDALRPSRAPLSGSSPSRSARAGIVVENAVESQVPVPRGQMSGVLRVDYRDEASGEQPVAAEDLGLAPPADDADSPAGIDGANATLGEMLENGVAGSDVNGLQIETFDPAGMLNAAEMGTRQPVEFFVSQALATHPSIQAARQRVAAELDRIPQVSSLPDPQFNNTFWPLEDNAIQTAAGRVANQMSLQQGIPFPDKLRTKAAVVSREAQVAQAEVERIERQITESVRLAYYEIWYATRAIAIIEQTRDLVTDLTKVAEARYRSGGTQQDVLRAQLESDRLDDQLVQLRKKKEMSQADLAALLQQPASLIPDAVEELSLADAPMQLDDLIAQAEQCNPSLRGLAAEIQRDRQKQRLACLQKYPDVMVGLNWGIVSDGDNVLSGVANGRDLVSFTVGTTLPIWHQKINAGVREASRRTSSSVQRLEAERYDVQGRLRRLLAQADALVEQTDIYENRIIPRTESTLTLAIADYRGERTDFFTLIETYRELLMFETQLARLHATLAGTIAQIDRTVGCPY